MRNWIIIAAILVVVGLIGLGVTFKSTGFSIGTVEIEKQQQAVDAAGVERIRIENDSADITIVPSASDQIKAELSGNVSQKFIDDVKLSLKKEGDQVTIRTESHTGFTIGINILNLKLKVELPEREYRELVLDSSSGEIQVQDMLAQTFEIEAESGDISLEELTGDQMSVKTSSGDIMLGKLTGKEINVHASSGDIKLEKATADELTIDVSSGDIKLKDADAKLLVDTSSGEIVVSQAAITHPMTLSTGSGDVVIHTDRQPESAQIRYNSGSGDLVNSWKDHKSSTDGDDYETITFGDGSVIVSVETGSGDLLLGRR
ncbi:DUF4097 family beta strand repeat-containing protein [Paenibacillus mendelii]|uniref:DUF4097 family beta strand repeat-containing protein n=1 Tax=Paenibacillus mendelii TaxID=206163 RepID=A0ABV6JE91_9BACL|nr:DUF4097 family beta strand repeat-containing protein [Paenibacillus mendelii]MCQ6562467.1 DUF4097 domain-containing protein [Paenibacillus mendelii]